MELVGLPLCSLDNRTAVGRNRNEDEEVRA
nr:MAG TPA: hypothetical protein [Caudoviricetes sp.]